MARNLEPKCKQCRREGTKLFLKGERCASVKCPMVKRNYPPGVHGVKGEKRSSEYGQQLREKQKAKKIYGILERQFRRYYQQAIGRKGDTGEILKQLLESRFDNIIYRIGWAKSRQQARQLIGHNYFLINHKKVNIPSYRLKPRDEITVKPQKSELKILKEFKLEKDKLPGWIAFDETEMKAKVVNIPKAEEMEQNFNPRLIVEFYSR